MGLYSMENYDLIIMGGGAAGFAAANQANRLKKRTLLINNPGILPLGGTCVNVGCVPSKIMLHQGSEYYYSKRSRFRAIKLEGEADFVDALRQTREMVAEFQAKNYVNVIQKQDYIDFKEGHASFLDPHTVQADGEEFQGDFILIATGASTAIPPIEGIEDIDYLTNVNVFNLDRTPESVIILGGGPLGMEFSQIFHHFDVEVTVLQRSGRILPKLDPLLGETLKKHLEEEGITIHTNAITRKLQKTGKGVKAIVEIQGKTREISAERLMLATGLSPRTQDLNTEKAGVKLTSKGFVEVNQYQQTSQSHIFAAGDVTGIMPLETVAAKQGNFAVLNMFENARRTINYQTIPRAVFTSPEVASVGITEEEYREKHNTCLCTTMELEHVEKAAAIRDTRGLVRMVLEPETRRVIGVHIIGPLAADIITTATYAIENRMTIQDIRDTVHVFPTLSEMIKKSAQSFEQDLDEMACCVE